MHDGGVVKQRPASGWRSCGPCDAAPVAQPGVTRLRYTVSPGNAPSQAIIARFGLRLVGQQIDEEDGPQDIYEMDAETYRERWGS